MEYLTGSAVDLGLSYAYYSISGAIIAVAAISYLVKRRKFVAQIEKFPGPPVTSLFLGNLGLIYNIMKSTKSDMTEAVLQYTNSVPSMFGEHGVFRIWTGHVPIIIAISPEAAEPIMMSQQNITKSSFYYFFRRWAGDSLGFSRGEKWRHRRKMLIPTFHFRILDGFVPIINEHSATLLKLLEEESSRNNGIVENMTTYLTLAALDIICATAMGKNIDAQRRPETEYAKAVKQAQQALIYRSVRPWLFGDFTFYKTPEGRKHQSALDTIHEVSIRVLKERADEIRMERKKLPESVGNKTEIKDDEAIGSKKRMAFLDLLLNIHFEDGSLSMNDIREEVDFFMVAGHETAATGLLWATYLLGLHPEAQAKVHQELDDIFGEDRDREVTMDDIRQMKYIEWVAKESMRLYPSIPFVTREVTHKMTLNGYTAPVGAVAGFSIYLIHRDPRNWPEPEKFDPERFSPEVSKTRNPFAFVPFGAGPRNCPGMKFAMLEVKAVIAAVFRKFKVTSLVPRDKIRVTPLIALKVKTPMKMKLELR